MYAKTPMQKVILKLNKRNFPLSLARALEVFGREGDWHTKDYVSYVGSLEVWEINLGFLDGLKRNLPDAKIIITDSFMKIKTTHSKYDLIVVDNPQSTYGQNNEYCEHFELFPHIFRIAEDQCAIILNINTEPYNFHDDLSWWKRRADFYNTDHPQKLSFNQVKTHYEKICAQNNFNMKWSFLQKRNNFMYYLCFEMEKNKQKFEVS